MAYSKGGKKVYDIYIVSLGPLVATFLVGKIFILGIFLCQSAPFFVAS